MCPLQLLMGNMSLATLLAISPEPSTAMGGPTPATPHPTTLVVSIPTLGIKWQCPLPNQEVTSPWSGDEKAAGTSEDPPCHKQKNRKPLANSWRWSVRSFCKRLRSSAEGWGAYFRMNCPDFDHEVSRDLSHTFWEMVDFAGLLELDIHEVWDACTGWKDLHTANHAIKTSQRNIQFFCMVIPTKLPSIMGLNGIHSPEALHRWGGCSYCPQCAKEGPNEGTMINHLHTVHYHLGLVCALCLTFFTTSTDTMRKGRPCCKASATRDQEEEEASEEEYGDEDNGYLP